ncbi:L-serine dehydratase [Mangrovibacterium marinum]|uniref:L-serine dehydratase n=1 Tax=Mangrovibacterium marinum TaxID=1639118 RepID=A0A2T5C0C3_9BACT|nr:L-serine ammonia-lyase [Mangrovibacterium marinum]PTN07998.1 L-serine dehydratase [Mangrovibacterium marinum]
MESIKEIYRIGHGPSSSHTMGPRLAAERFLAQNDQAARFVCTLYGSLAATGKGHLTDAVINEVFAKHQLEIIWEPTVFLPHHPNALKLESFSNQGQLLCSKVTYSVGGGAIVEEGESVRKEQIYPYSTMDSILDWCHENGKQLWEYVEEFEGPGIWEFLHEIWTVMKDSIKRGQEREGTLPGELRLPRKAYAFKLKAENFSGPFKKRSELFSFALAVSEENAAGGLIVTAPTCGACGVVPAVLRYFNKTYKSDEKHVLKALATAGLIGTLVKTNASISGAEVGCQGEVGTACAMASAAATQLMGGTINQIEYSAEMGLEHHLGLTCDPVAGLVQIPCIERNAMAAERALAHNTYALMSDGRHRISFDEVVDTMYQTGKDLPNTYKETSQGGLARYQAKGKR